jgi:hypothetical protein
MRDHRRRTDSEVQGDALAAAIAATMGRAVRTARRARRMTQAELGERA